MTSCDPRRRATAVGGCDVRSLGMTDGADISDEDSLNQDAWINGIMGPNGEPDEVMNHEKINEGDTAYNWNYFVQEAPSSWENHVFLQETGGKPVVGLTEEEWDRANTDDWDQPPFAIYLRNTNELDVESREIANRIVCAEGYNNREAALDRYANIWAGSFADRLLYLKPNRVESSCAPSQGFWSSLFENIVFGEDKRDRYEDIKSSCGGVLTVTQGGSYSCFE
jgi:hypothetical protein